ncbi:MAG: sulfur oxidation c-type cytochrome SoxA [Betaproteobacteria bacterium]|nr:sulfur oxidation c-type cytochrome SoxA [Betaproteobacteria bacterium]NBY05484.1 sulfur oxidation c-type cytochrome SoxA [Betaproteobacteria bacterium]
MHGGGRMRAVAWLAVCLTGWVGMGLLGTAQANADLGWRIITERALGNCGACHAWQTPPASTSTFAPPLDGVALRYSATQLRQWLVDARHLRPDTLMPVFGSLTGLRQPAPAHAVLDAGQIDAVVQALQQHLPPARAELADRAAVPAPQPSPTAKADATQRQSGLAFLSPSLRQMNDDDMANPMSLWIERGLQAWGQNSGGPSCQSCHGAVSAMRKAVAQHPKLSPDGLSLRNLDDQIGVCRQRQGAPSALPDETVLALSAALHHAARGEPIAVQAPLDRQAAWQAQWQAGADQYQTRQGRMNLSCAHCHDQRVGAQMRGDIISPGHPTGFPIYRLSWQQAGGMDRRLRACFSGVQSAMPEPGSAILRNLELYLKVRANGMPLEGPSVRR